MDGHASPNFVPDSSLANARTFTTNKWDRLGMTGIGAVFILGGGALPFILEPDHLPLTGAGIFIAIGVVFLLISEVVMARRRLVLSDDGAEFRTLFGTRSLAVSEIKGFRAGGDAKHPTLELIPTEPGLKKLSIPLSLDDEGAIPSWAAARFPDLDAIELQTDLESILADDEFGFTVEERQAFLDRQQLVFKTLTGAAVAVALWAWFFPRPYEVVMGAQLLVLVCALASGALGRGLMVLWGKGKAHPTAALAILMPALVCLVRAMLDVTLDSWSAALVPIAVGTAVWMLLLLLCFRESRESPAMLGGALMIAALLGAGSVLQLNFLVDNGEPTIHETTVLDKRFSNGKSKTYTLVLEPWKEGQTPVDYTTDEELYQSLEPGQTAWLWTMPGALRIPWTFVTTPQE